MEEKEKRLPLFNKATSFPLLKKGRTNRMKKWNKGTWEKERSPRKKRSGME